jgi:hypothetical protein
MTAAHEHSIWRLLQIVSCGDPADRLSACPRVCSMQTPGPRRQLQAHIPRDWHAPVPEQAHPGHRSSADGCGRARRYLICLFCLICDESCRCYQATQECAEGNQHRRPTSSRVEYLKILITCVHVQQQAIKRQAYNLAALCCGSAVESLQNAADSGVAQSSVPGCSPGTP